MMSFHTVHSGKGGLGSLASSQSVSFRAGSNVEFGGVGTPVTPGGAGGDAYALDEPARKGRDFSNPMYEAVTRAAAAGEPEPPLRECSHRISNDRVREQSKSLTMFFSSRDLRSSGRNKRQSSVGGDLPVVHRDPRHPAPPGPGPGRGHRPRHRAAREGGPPLSTAALASSIRPSSYSTVNCCLFFSQTL